DCDGTDARCVRHSDSALLGGTAQLSPSISGTTPVDIRWKSNQDEPRADTRVAGLFPDGGADQQGGAEDEDDRRPRISPGTVRTRQLRCPHAQPEHGTGRERVKEKLRKHDVRE